VVPNPPGHYSRLVGKLRRSCSGHSGFPAGWSVRGARSHRDRNRQLPNTILAKHMFFKVMALLMEKTHVSHARSHIGTVRAGPKTHTLP
jgi:hypothetical protein